MNLHERSLSVTACQYVDEVIISAPWEIAKDMITMFKFFFWGCAAGTILSETVILHVTKDSERAPSTNVYAPLSPSLSTCHCQGNDMS